MQGIILAAGKGSRLHPLTTNRSKAMLPILGKPMVVQVMEGLIRHGINDFILVISPEDREIVRYFQAESHIDAEVRFVYQPERLGAGNALEYAAPLIEADFILSACDNLVSDDHLSELLHAWNADPKPNAVMSIMKVNPEHLSRTGVVLLNDHWITYIVEKPEPGTAPSNTASLPLYIFPLCFIEYLPSIQKSKRGEFELQDAIQRLISEQGKVKGVYTQSRLTLTNPGDLLAINRAFLVDSRGQPQIQPLHVGPDTHLITPLYIERETTIGTGCTIGPNVYIERGCHIGDGVTIREAVLLRDVAVESHTRIENQVVS